MPRKVQLVLTLARFCLIVFVLKPCWNIFCQIPFSVILLWCVRTGVLNYFFYFLCWVQPRFRFCPHICLVLFLIAFQFTTSGLNFPAHCLPLLLGDENKVSLLVQGALNPLCQLIAHNNKLVRRNAFMALGIMSTNGESFEINAAHNTTNVLGIFTYRPTFWQSICLAVPLTDILTDGRIHILVDLLRELLVVDFLSCFHLKADVKNALKTTDVIPSIIDKLSVEGELFWLQADINLIFTVHQLQTNKPVISLQCKMLLFTSLQHFAWPLCRWILSAKSGSSTARVCHH